LRAAGDDGDTAIEIDLVHGEIPFFIPHGEERAFARVSNHEARGPSLETALSRLLGMRGDQSM
jgi:hypothetical protein